VDDVASALAADTGIEDSQRRVREGIVLCLSGGGYRAMLFHLGVLQRLNDAAYLPKLSRISSVSGGSIIAGVLGLAWPQLAFDACGRAQQFQRLVVHPVRMLASTTIDASAVIRGFLGPGTASDHIADAYRTRLFGDHTLQDLPDDGAGPRFVFNASNMQSGVLLRFSRPYAWDYRVGQIKHPTIDLAVAVAASSAFPPFLSPTVLHLPDGSFTPGSGTDLQAPPYTTRMTLTDGGVYDNLGLETAWKTYRTVLVSDGGGRMKPDTIAWYKHNWFSQLLRVRDMTDNQVRALRKQQVIDSFMLPAQDPSHRDGSYWGIWTDITHYGLMDTLPCPFEETAKLAAISTRLARVEGRTQERLINWGYAVCDAALRKWVDSSIPVPTGFPFPIAAVG